MDFTLNEQVLTIKCVGEINSGNAEDVENKINDIILNHKNEFNKLILDFNSVTYISSAGLRIILKLKKLYNNVSVINVNLEVYDILSMTGFTNILEVKKALQEISVDGCDIIGEGFAGTVYRISNDTIIKVFKNETNIPNIERELKLAKEAFILGIPTAISFDVVKVKDKYGVRFEMLDATSLRDLFRDNPDRFDELVKKYAELLKIINTTESNDENLPSTKASWLNKIEFIKEYLDNNDYLKMKKLIEGIDERITLIHGDCHIKNILSQKDDLLLIDMDTLSRGHPIFELAAIYATYIVFEEDAEGNSEKFLGIPKKLSIDIYYNTLKYYLPEYNEDILNKIRIVSYIHMLWWNKTFEPNNTIRFNGCKERLLKLLPLYDDLNIGL